MSKRKKKPAQKYESVWPKRVNTLLGAPKVVDINLNQHIQSGANQVVVNLRYDGVVHRVSLTRRTPYPF